MSALSLVLLVALAQVGGADPEAEHAEVQDRLVVERALLATLQDRSADVLGVIDIVERRAQATRARADALAQEIAALERRREIAERLDALARADLEEKRALLRPRLRAMHRLSQRSRLDVLLSAEDFGALVWRTRALSTLLERDLRLVEETRRAIAHQERARRAVERVHAAVDARARQLAFEQELAARQQDLLAGVLGGVSRDAAQAQRLVRELEAAERRLARLIGDFDARGGADAFSALKGTLHWPAPGIVEVGFGKVVNPRFNTVTFQKGLDIRARAGTPVRAVASGRVVYAGWLRGYGNLLIVDHGAGYHSLVAHLSHFSRGVGDEVEAEEEIGTVGDTGSLKGPYVYFELRRNGVAVDPRPWLAPAAR